MGTSTVEGVRLETCKLKGRLEMTFGQRGNEGGPIFTKRDGDSYTILKHLEGVDFL